jgi:hypothetical protein
MARSHKSSKRSDTLQCPNPTAAEACQSDGIHLTQGAISGWSERTCANWRVWSGANDALRGSVDELEAFLGEDGPQAG